MGFCRRYVEIERNGVKASAYALIDTGSDLSAVSEEVASRARLQMDGQINIRSKNGGARAWVSEEARMTFAGRGEALPSKVVVVPKRITGEDMIIGRDILDMLAPEDIAGLRYTCDSCRGDIMRCRCSRTAVQRLG